MIERICALLDSHRFNFQTEGELQNGIAAVLTDQRIPFVREHRLTGADRIDFLAAGLGIEIKVGGSLSAIIRQLHRYAQSAEITALLLVTTKASHLEYPQSLNGKPVHCFFLSLRRAL